MSKGSKSMEPFPQTVIDLSSDSDSDTVAKLQDTDCHIEEMLQDIDFDTEAIPETFRQMDSERHCYEVPGSQSHSMSMGSKSLKPFPPVMIDLTYDTDNETEETFQGTKKQRLWYEGVSSPRTLHRESALNTRMASLTEGTRPIDYGEIIDNRLDWTLEEPKFFYGNSEGYSSMLPLLPNGTSEGYDSMLPLLPNGTSEGYDSMLPLLPNGTSEGYDSMLPLLQNDSPSLVPAVDDISQQTNSVKMDVHTNGWKNCESHNQESMANDNGLANNNDYECPPKGIFGVMPLFPIKDEAGETKWEY